VEEVLAVLISSSCVAIIRSHVLHSVLLQIGPVDSPGGPGPQAVATHSILQSSSPQFVILDETLSEHAVLQHPGSSFVTLQS